MRRKLYSYVADDENVSMMVMLQTLAPPVVAYLFHYAFHYDDDAERNGVDDFGRISVVASSYHHLQVVEELWEICYVSLTLFVLLLQL